MKPFVINRYGRIVFPFNFLPELDFSIFETLEQFAAVIKGDFEEKAPSETDIVAGVDARAHRAVRPPARSRPQPLLGEPLRDDDVREAPHPRLLQEVDRPVLVVCGEKFSDKIGTVRTSRMIFGARARAEEHRDMRIFAPGFGAGAVAGYVVARIDPAIVAV